MMAMSATMHPIWVTGAFVLTFGVFLAVALQVLVHRFIPAALRREHTQLGAAIFCVIGTTYAVLLAFMAMTAWEQHSLAEALTRREANAAGSIFGSSEALSEPARSAVQHLVENYLAHVVEVEWPSQVAGRELPASEVLLVRLRRAALTTAPAFGAQADVRERLLSEVDAIESARRDRRLAVHGLIPGLVWTVLLCGGALMVGFSFLLGGFSSILHMLMTAALVASGLLVVLLIVGLSSPFHGAVTVSPAAYASVLAEIRAGV